MLKFPILICLLFSSLIVASTEKTVTSEDMLKFKKCIKNETKCSRDCDSIKDDEIATNCMNQCEAQYDKCIEDLTK